MIRDFSNSMAFDVPVRPPDHVCYAPRVDVSVYLLEPVAD